MASPDLDWVEKVAIRADAITVFLAIPGTPTVRMETTAHLTIQRRGVERKLVLAGGPASKAEDQVLIKTVGRALRWWEMLRTQKARSVTEIAAAEQINPTYVTALLPLAFLSPTIVRAIAQGEQPATLTAHEMTTRLRLPGNWQEQERMINF